MKPNSSNFHDQQATQTFEPNDLEWLAFCYVADELDASERESFELRLDQDQEARDAVASVVVQTGVLNAAFAATPQVELKPQIPAKNDGPGRVSHLGWQRALLLVTSAAVVLVFAFLWQPGSTPESTNDNGDVAEIWSNEVWSEYDLAATDSLFGDGRDDMDEEVERTEVTWLVAALVDPENEQDPFEMDLPEMGDGDPTCIQ